MKHHISIIIPAHNEEKRIKRTLERYLDFFNKKKKAKEIEGYEIIIVLNACTDNTLEIVKKIGKKHKEASFRYHEQAGKGFAIIEGFKEALMGKSNLIGFVDADMATSPEEFYKLIERIDGNDGAIASRWIKGSVIETNQTLLRKIMSRGFNFLVNALFGLSIEDTQCGAKVFKREALGKIIDELGITAWAFDVDILYRLKKNKMSVVEVPTIWNECKNSKLNVTKVPLQMFLSIIRLRLINSPFKFSIKLYDKLPESIKIHHRF